MKLKNLLQRRNPEKFKESRECFNDIGLTSGVQKFKAPVFGSIALMLKVYANDANHQDNEKILIVDSVNKAFETLKIVFTRRVDTLPKDVDSQQHSESSKSLTSDESKCWYPSCISRYLQDCQRQNQSASLCKTMMTKTCTTTNEPRMFVAYRKRENRVEYTQQDLVDIANVLMKLKKYLKQHCQRQRLIAAGKAATKLSSSSGSSSCCDKAVQCDYLQVSPEVRFFSRSSLVINATSEGKPQQQQQQQRRRNSSPSLEYVANYRPEFHARNNNNNSKSLRSLSSSAIFGLPREKLNYSRSPPRRNRLKRGGVPSLDTMKRRTEDDMHRYSNFIEADLTSFHYNQKFRASESSTQLDRNDVLAVRKILLDDYITEVKEIIRSELSGSESPTHESQILDNVRKRIDEDVLLSGRTDSYHTLSPTTSYVTARECLSSCCCCCCLCDCADSSTCLKLCELACSKRKIPGKNNCTSYLANKDRYSKIVNEDDKSASSTSAKSSQSVDSGVQMDFPRSTTTTTTTSTTITDCNWSDDLMSVNDFKNSEKKGSSCCSESTSSSGDEMLCRRVESAVRKFTEKLIVCERRARDRSRSRGSSVKRQQNPRLKQGCTSLTDQTRYKSFNCSRDEMVNCSSEDERITGISTPSLVSLSDEEIRT